MDERFDEHITVAHTFLADLLSQYTIEPDVVQVAMIRQTDPAVVDWNWQSPETADFDTLINNINTVFVTTSGSVGDVNVGLAIAASDVIDSQHDRDDAVNILITMGHGEDSRDLLNLADVADTGTK